GAGNDVYTVDNTGDAVVENVNEGNNDTVYASVNYLLGGNVENLILTGAADLQGFCNSLTNTVYGNSGANLLDGGAGADGMFGGLGNDAYVVDNNSDAVVENANEGNDTVYASVNYALGADVENLIQTGSADVQGYGNALVNSIFGNSGS